MILDWNKRDQNLGTGKVWLDGEEIHHVDHVDTDQIKVRRVVRDTAGRAIKREALTGHTLRIEFADGTLLLTDRDKKPLS